MDLPHHDEPSLGDRMTSLWRSGVRLAARLALAFGISTAAAIGLGIAITDNVFVQIVVIVLGALAFWIPAFLLVRRVECFFDRRRAARLERAAGKAALPQPKGGQEDASWRRLAAIAPAQAERLTALRRSIDRSRLSLGSADLDPEAHDLCVLIDRRLPELIHRELDSLAPDDRGRARQIGELIDLIEQFARHCSRKDSGNSREAGHEAAILRRRFEAHLTGY